MIQFYSIYKERDIRSTDLANETISSAKNFGIKVKLQNGVYNNIPIHLKKNNLKINELGSHKIQNNGILGCFLSHFYLWKKCVSSKTPIGVLEYDAIFIKPLPEDILDKFDHYLNLDYSRHLYLDAHEDIQYENFVVNDNRDFSVEKLLESNIKAKTTKPFKYINNNHIKGAFGYIIKPEGAKLLIDATYEHGVLPADIQPNLMYCNIHYTIPSIVMLNPKSLIDRVKHSHTAIDRTDS